MVYLIIKIELNHLIFLKMSHYYFIYIRSICNKTNFNVNVSDFFQNNITNDLSSQTSNENETNNRFFQSTFNRAKILFEKNDKVEDCFSSFFLKEGM
jgi:hypothetical protein